MKKSVVLALTGGLLLTGCSSQLSTPDTCAEFRAFMTTSCDLSSLTKDKREQAFDVLDSLAKRSSDELKSIMDDIAYANRERFNDDPDLGGIGAAQERLNRNETFIRATCLI